MTNKSYCNRWEPLVEIKRVRWELCVARLFFTLLVTVPAARCGDAPQWMHAVANAALPDHDERQTRYCCTQKTYSVCSRTGRSRKWNDGCIKSSGSMADITVHSTRISMPSQKSIVFMAGAFPRKERITR